jgi:hypothetical protein
MNETYVNIITTLSGIVIITACFAGFLVYLLKGRKEKDWRVVISVPLVISFLVGAGYFEFFAPKVLVPLLSPQKQTLEAFCDDIKNSDYSSLYDLYAPDGPVRKKYTRAQFIQEIQIEVNEVQGIFDCTVGNDIEVNSDSETATGIVTVIDGLDQAVDTTVLLRKEDNEWKILAIGNRQLV